jgi:hypothetical protein
MALPCDPRRRSRLLGRRRAPADRPRPETVAAIRRILLIARFDIAVLLLVVADMITKPFG